MSKERPSVIRRAIQEVFNPSLALANQEFREIALQLTRLDPLKLPKQLNLFIDGQFQRSIERVPGNAITMAIFDEKGSPPWIGHHFDKKQLPDLSFWVLIFPEIFPDNSHQLSFGLVKRDGRHIYTGWSDSFFQLGAQPRHRERSPNLWLVQNIHPSVNHTHEDMEHQVWRQLEANKEFGAMFLFTPGAVTEEKHKLQPFRTSLDKLLVYQ